MNYWEMRVEPVYLGDDIFTTEDDAYTMRIRYETITCKFCNSPDIVKNGTFRGTQRWLCRNCGRAFVDNKALPKMKFSIDEVSSALGMYFRGLSLKKISHQLQAQHGYSPSDIAIYNWVVRFSKIAILEAESHTPNVSDTWIADETVLKIGGKKYWLHDIIDSETRYLLATHLSSTRSIKDSHKLMELASKKAGKVPKVVITDGLANYVDAIELAFGADTKHIVTKPFTVEINTNIIERLQGTIKERTKVMRGMKKLETARLILNSWTIFYNHFRPHMSLQDRTPAEVARVDFPYKNWKDVVNSQAGTIRKLDGTKIVAVIPKQVITFPPTRRPAYRKRLKKPSKQIVPTLAQTRTAKRRK